MAVQENSAGVVIFRREGGVAKFVLLFKKYRTEYWDLPKGNIGKGEKAEETARREALEETGIGDLKFVPGFKEKLQWWYKLEGRLTRKTVVYFLAETRAREIKVSEEHIKGGWFTLEEAEKVIKHKDTMELLRKAQAFIDKQEKEGLRRFL